jgi:putative N-acetylmannosamine-6-phosphate epimerase
MRISSSLLLFVVELSAADAADAVNVVAEADVEAVALALKPPFSSSVSIISELFDSPVLGLCLDDDEEPSVLLEAVRDRAARIMARRLSM